MGAVAEGDSTTQRIMLLPMQAFTLQAWPAKCRPRPCVCWISYLGRLPGWMLHA